MGLFSGKKKTYVASTVYNLAGDSDLRPNVLRTLLLGSILSGSKEPFPQVLTKGLQSGLGRQQRSFFRWAQTHYDLGLPTAIMSGTVQVDMAALLPILQGQIALDPGQQLRLLSAVIDNADIDYWARPWVMTSYPDATDDQWSADWDPVGKEIEIDVTTLDPEHPTHIMAAPADLLWGLARTTTKRRLLFCTYQVLSAPDALGQVSAGSPALFVYRMGSGVAALDALGASATVLPEFFPILPLRLNNKSIRDPALKTTYDAVAPAYRKLTRAKVDDLLDQIESNAHIADIDFCFLVQGVALNTKDNDAREFLYRFFKGLMPLQRSSKSGFETHLAGRKAALQDNVAIDRWLKSAAYTGTPSYLLGITEPSSSELSIYAANQPDFDFRLRWVYADESQFLGNGKTHDGNQTRGLMKKGEYWFSPAPDLVLPAIPRSTSNASWASPLYTATSYNRLWLFHQHSAHAYSRLELVGLEHVNLVYGGHSVTISGKDALADSDVSGFLVPLHYPTLRDMGLLRNTQLAGVSAHLVFNTYQVVKQKWYQTGFFRIILTIAMAVLSVVMPPAGAGLTAAGILGTNLAVGAALGFTSVMAAAIAGAIANAVAAMIVTALIQKGATHLFGEKYGQIIGTIVSFVALNYGKAYATTGKFDVDWGKLMRIDNLSKLTDSVTGAYSLWTKVNIANLAEDAERLGKDYKTKSEEIAAKSKEMLGMTAGEIDPMMFTDASEHSMESVDAFIGRTTMTGSELAELSQLLVYEFAEMSLELPMVAP